MPHQQEGDQLRQQLVFPRLPAENEGELPPQPPRNALPDRLRRRHLIRPHLPPALRRPRKTPRTLQRQPQRLPQLGPRSSALPFTIRQSATPPPRSPTPLPERSTR